MERPTIRHERYPRIFLAYAHGDLEEVRKVYNQLVKDGYDPWLDEICLLPGQEWENEIRKAIFNSDVFIPFFSNRAIEGAGYIRDELRIAIETAQQRKSSELFLVPANLDNCPIPPGWSHLHYADLGVGQWDDGYKKIVKFLLSLRDPSIPEEGWEALEKVVRDAALIAGMAAMRYYRDALSKQDPLTTHVNPSTKADEYATVSLLQTLHTVERLTSELNCQYVVFAEELDDPVVAPRILENFKEHPVSYKIRRSTEEFRAGWKHNLAILVDAIDGTANFDAGLPFFGSAVAAFFKGQLRAGAVYDPFHHQVFYGSIPGRTPDEHKRMTASVWSINSGRVEPLRKLGARVSTNRCLIATHLTRSDEKARNRFLKFLPHLYEEPSLKCGTYMLNSGQMALAHVAWGNLDAFINNRTKIWDVAAGEVLIRAVGGKVTDFEGHEIDYGACSDTSVLACRTPELHKRLLSIIRKHYVSKSR